MRWDGTAWGVRSAPGGTTGAILWAVTRAGTTDLFAAGAAGDAQPLLLRRHQGVWRTVATPALPTGSTGHLLGLTAVSGTDIWAVGSSKPRRTATSTLIEHWTPASAQIVPTPNPYATNVFGGVAVLSDGSLVAVGAGRSANWHTIAARAISG